MLLDIGISGYGERRALRFDAPPVAITFWRWAVALAVLLPFTWPYLREHWRIVLRSWKILALLGLLASVLQHIPVYTGLRYTTATNGALLNATNPAAVKRGKARAAKLSPARRKEIAKKAARTRWAKKG